MGIKIFCVGITVALIVHAIATKDVGLVVAAILCSIGCVVMFVGEK